MGLVLLVGVLFVVAVSGKEVSAPSSEPKDETSHTDLQQAFVIFRHGDRTPDGEELALSGMTVDKKVFFPYGEKALTNKGKQRAFSVGEYLRHRYGAKEWLSELYLPDQVKIRTTPYDRTKMTGLAALAALYPPQTPQRWNPELNWQPVPYDVLEYEDDDFMYWYNCPPYLTLKDAVYSTPEFEEWLKPYKDLFPYLRKNTGTNITTPEDVFFYDNLLQTLSNVGINPPKWAVEVLLKIKEVTKLEYAAEYYTPELIKLSSGVLLEDILNYTSSFISGYTDQPKLRLYSAHENNVAALMAASRTFVPHQPNYGATFSLELRKGCKDSKYYIAAVYAKDAGGPGRLLPIAGCGEKPLCEYNKFMELVKDYAITRQKYYAICGIKR